MVFDVLRNKLGHRCHYSECLYPLVRASLCCLHRHPTHQQGLDLARGDPAWEIRFYSVAMLEQIHLLAAVTVLGVLEQAYFFLQVIHARRTFGVSPPNISGPPEFERIFRAQVNSSEYFPIFVALLWQAGLFFHQGLAAALGLLYLYSRYCYFTGYRASSSDRLTPIYFSTGVLWVLVAAATLGLLHFFLSHYVGLNVLRLLAA
ncbi:leukotriene C4 synthase-like isoform X1 [Centrocercus urophasianus]|uniref:leukotriene C4 synthase-like isoform X1 n=1 Tax=Centrocercus urophasianus TaxID=9002 RepID=UPI001C64F929|nr:leukotriene C4 synthase-like isoform X1 [Centrocercus urophasianus]XP_042682244.1 leukotriene C4 synthase-like isoform X1 [Centrocercus urophasianus]